MSANTKLFGVEIAGTGRYLPEKLLTNADLSKMVDTSDEWIVQRTGIRERRICDPEKNESTRTLSQWALERALEDAQIDPKELDLVILGSVTGDMRCPATACRIAADVGAVNAGAFDLLAACSGFVYGLNIAHDMIRLGSQKTIAVIGCDTMSTVMDYTDRSICVLFGDSAGATILRATDDTSKGMRVGAMHANGEGWQNLYLPERVADIPKGIDPSGVMLHTLQMSGREVYKFAMGTFPRLIEETIERANITPNDVDMYICHQSNIRMLDSARDRLGIPPEKMYINIDRYGNCSAGSVPVCLDELRKNGKCKEGDLVRLNENAGAWAGLFAIISRDVDKSGRIKAWIETFGRATEIEMTRASADHV